MEARRGNATGAENCPVEPPPAEIGTVKSTAADLGSVEPPPAEIGAVKTTDADLGSVDATVSLPIPQASG